MVDYDDLMPPKGQEDEKGVKYAWADKCPVVLLLDTSGSMRGEPIKELEEGLKLLIDEILRDEEAKQRVEIAIVTFGGTVNIVRNFTLAEDIKLPSLKAGGSTPMGEALIKAIELVSNRKKELRENGVNYFRPWIVLITDGYPTDMDGGKFDRIKQKLEEGEKNKHFIVWFFGTEGADFSTLTRLNPNIQGRVYKLKEHKFRDIFKWISNSMKVVSRSAPGQKTNLSAPSATSSNIEVVSLEV